MAIIQIEGLPLGTMVRFRTVSPHDNVVWTGRLDAYVTYDIARTLYDVDPMYYDVKKVRRDMDAKEKLVYLVITVAENETKPIKRVFATDWVDPATVEVVQENTYKDFRVYDIDPSKVEDLRHAIAAMGYTVAVLES